MAVRAVRGDAAAGAASGVELERASKKMKKNLNRRRVPLSLSPLPSRSRGPLPSRFLSFSLSCERRILHCTMPPYHDAATIALN